MVKTRRAAPTGKWRCMNVVNILGKLFLNRKDIIGITGLLLCLTNGERPSLVIFDSMTGRMFILNG